MIAQSETRKMYEEPTFSFEKVAIHLWQDVVMTESKPNVFPLLLLMNIHFHTVQFVTLVLSDYTTLS